MSPSSGVIRVVLPVYKCRRESAWEVSHAVGDRAEGRARLRLDLFNTFACGDGETRLGALLQEAAESGTALAAARLTSQALQQGATVVGDDSDLRSDQDVAALTTILDAVSAAGIDVLVCSSWFTPGSSQLVPGLAALPRTLLVGVSVQDSAGDPASRMIVEALDELNHLAGARLISLHLTMCRGGDPQVRDGITPSSAVTVAACLSEIRRAVPVTALNQVLQHLQLEAYSESIEHVRVEVREPLSADLQRFGFCAPFIPAELARSLEFQGPSQYGDAEHPYMARRNYLLRGVISDLAEGDWRPRIQINYFGHGLNSYAWTYVLVTREVAVVGQVHAGGAFGDLDAARRHWESLMTDAQVLRRQALESTSLRERGALLVFVHSPLRRRSGWAELQRSTDGRIELDTGLDPLSEFPVLH